MAQRHITRLVDDIDGSEAVGTVTFGLDGESYAMELNADHELALREALAPFIEHARELRPERRPATRKTKVSPLDSVKRVAARIDPSQSAHIRAWANNNGYSVSAKGRISPAVQEAYQLAHA